MGRRALSLHWILVVTLAAAVAGCGGGGGNGGFESCGNGVLDKGEQCDDGNLDDGDACLSTCEPNVCGDGFVNVHVEQCEPFVKILTQPTTVPILPSPQPTATPAQISCADFGFAMGDLACSTGCTIDTSGCSGVAQPTATFGIPTPSASPTPGSGATCQAGQTLIVTAALDKAFAGFTIDLTYPLAVNLPGSGASVADRVAFQVSGGLTIVNDEDDVGDDGVDDTVVASFAGSADQSPGPVITVTFDCVADQPRPSAADFGCVASASTADGSAVPGVGCALTVQ